MTLARCAQTSRTGYGKQVPRGMLSDPKSYRERRHELDVNGSIRKIIVVSRQSAVAGTDLPATLLISFVEG